MRTVIFGGAFDPPHSEHVKALKCAVETFGAKRAVILPTYLPPHKSRGFLDFDTRAELARAAFDGVAGGGGVGVEGVRLLRRAEGGVRQ